MVENGKSQRPTELLINGYIDATTAEEFAKMSETPQRTSRE